MRAHQEGQVVSFQQANEEPETFFGLHNPTSGQTRYIRAVDAASATYFLAKTEVLLPQTFTLQPS